VSSTLVCLFCVLRWLFGYLLLFAVFSPQFFFIVLTNSGCFDHEPIISFKWLTLLFHFIIFPSVWGNVCYRMSFGAVAPLFVY